MSATDWIIALAIIVTTMLAFDRFATWAVGPAPKKANEPTAE